MRLFRDKKYARQFWGVSIFMALVDGWLTWLGAHQLETGWVFGRPIILGGWGCVALYGVLLAVTTLQIFFVLNARCNDSDSASQ
jgi:hypothetical protein